MGHAPKADRGTLKSRTRQTTSGAGKRLVNSNDVSRTFVDNVVDKNSIRKEFDLPDEGVPCLTPKEIKARRLISKEEICQRTNVSVTRYMGWRRRFAPAPPIRAFGQGRDSALRYYSEVEVIAWLYQVKKELEVNKPRFSKRVRHVATRKIYSSQQAAADAFGVSAGQMSAHLRFGRALPNGERFERVL